MTELAVDMSAGLSTPPGVIKRHRFRAVAAVASTDFAPVDIRSFVSDLEKALTALAGLPCRITAVDEGTPDALDSTPPEAMAESTSWYTTTGGGWLGVALSTTLAEALVSQRCGGGLTGDDGRLGATASVLRLHSELLALTRRTAAASWLPLASEWAVAAIQTASTLPRLRRHMISVGELSCPLGIAVEIAGSGQSATPALDRFADLHRSLQHIAFPVRAVLFETRLPLAKAAQLRPGDVLPIETPRDVGLRVGAYRLASGTIAPTGDGRHLVTIRTSSRSVCSATFEKAPQ